MHRDSGGVHWDSGGVHWDSGGVQRYSGGVHRDNAQFLKIKALPVFHLT